MKCSNDYGNENTCLIRVNRDFPIGAKENDGKTIAFDEDIAETVKQLLEGLL